MGKGEDIKKEFIKENPGTKEEFDSFGKKHILSIPYFEENRKKIMIARGSIIDMAIGIESVFNEVLLLSDKPQSITYDFKPKVKLIKKIISKVDKDNYFKSDFFRKLNDMVLIRNLFAHVPILPFSEELIFEINKPYDVFFHGRFELKMIKGTIIKFTNLCKDIQKENITFFKMIKEYVMKKENKE